MEHAAWKSVAFAYPRVVPSMLSDDEKRYLFWLGKHVWSGAGAVVEIGPWLGGSTVCLSAGMRASGRPAAGKLFAIDNFLWRAFMSKRAPLALPPGDSFEAHFLQNVAEYRDMVVSLARALPDEVIEGDADAGATRFDEERVVATLDGLPGVDPVEVLFVDGAKSCRGTRHLLLALCDRFIPGRTLLACQDFKFWGAYWVPLTIARLESCLEPVHNVLAGTTVTFRLTSPLRREAVQVLADHVSQVPTDEGLSLLDRAASWLRDDRDPAGAANLSLARVRFLAHQGHVERAAAEFERLQASWPALGDVAQVILAGNYVAARRGRKVARPLRIRLALVRQRARGAWRKRTARE